MRIIGLALFLLFVISICEGCQTTEEDCENLTTEYDKYRECMEKRSKRSVGCYHQKQNSCDDCDCQECNNSCETCDQSCCKQCCQKSSCTSTSCCQQTCRAECRSHACRTSCKKKCQEMVAPLPQIPPAYSQTKTANNQQHNITTVIHLNNIINNTNLINLPISVNNTVLNNFTNENTYGSGSYNQQQIGSQTENCCLTVGPRQCIPQSSFPFMRCFHVRRRNCGSVCSAPVVHFQQHEICDGDASSGQCHQQMVYVPQPQPKCAYTSQWPYVTCGNSQESQSCEGCYNHYIKREDITKCSNFCYDDGYGVGPYYRQGPFYRPGFAHVPSCLQTGLCGSFGNYGFMDYGSEMGNSLDSLPSIGFPNVYPPQTYPFMIEDCENCTFQTGPVTDTVNSPAELYYKSLETGRFSTPPEKLVNIGVTVSPVQSEKYAEIVIRPTDENENTTTVDSSSSSE